MAYAVKTTEEKLLYAFKRFNKGGWKLTFLDLGYNASEIIMLLEIYKYTLNKAAGIKVSELSELLDIAVPTTTQLLNKMEQMGAVGKVHCPNDRRVVRIILTEQGKKVAIETKEVYVRYYKGLKEYLGEKESLVLAELLNKAQQYFEEKF